MIKMYAESLRCIVSLCEDCGRHSVVEKTNNKINSLVEEASCCRRFTFFAQPYYHAQLIGRKQTSLFVLGSKWPAIYEVASSFRTNILKPDTFSAKASSIILAPYSKL